MNLTIAICDDDPIQVDTLVSYIKLFNIGYEIETVKSLKGKELLQKIERKKIDVAFLDIEMEGMSGIELGAKIRQKYEDCIIVFITGFKDYALDAFDINAFNYILKPITEKRLKRCMYDIILRFEEKKAFKQKNNSFTICNKNNILKIKYEDIFYFEKLLNKIRIYTIRNEYEFYGTFKRIKKDIDMEKTFIQCHQGYIVNISKIYEFRNEKIYFTDIEKSVPVSRRYKSKVREILFKNLFS